MIQLSLQDLENNFSARTSFKIARILAKLTEEVENFNKIRNDIFTKYGEFDPQGHLRIDGTGAVIIKKECREQYDKEVTDLLRTEISIMAEPLKIDELEHIVISPNKLVTLSNFIVE